MDRQDKYPSRMTIRKDKKVNKVYNILISVVVLLIIAVGAFIFMGKDEEPVSQNANSNSESTQSANSNKEEANQAGDDESASDDKEQSAETEKDQSKEQDENSSEDQDTSSEEDTDTVESEKVEEEATDGNVEEAYSDPSWKPVGTEQSGEHVTQFEKGSTDWNEMERAIAYGAGLDQSNMTLWYLQNGGEPNKAIGTVSPKDGSSTYRVYIQWVDGEGWKPTKVEKLLKNDKAS